MRATASLFLISAIGLSACSETAGSNVAAYNSKISTHSNPFIGELAATTATQVTSAPVEGVASMTGTFLLQTPAGMTGVNQIGGQIDMGADFAAETVTGSMYQFIETYTDNTATSISGTASFSGIVDFDTPTTYDVVASGTGSFTTTDNQSYSISTNLNGNVFRRPGNELASAGILSASATSGSYTHGLVGTYHVTE